jgi:AraC family transcriptional regulator of adaptative response / DNA-3-methyladenine glycosylase II
MDAPIQLDVRALDRARISRDPRFDGKFFIAVTTTRIYCRPICPVRSPKRTNIRYYATAAAAAEAGYRPCLRCRPEAAPGTPAWSGTSAIVKRALRLIEDGILDKHSVQLLADKVGVGPRHLHRLFLQHVGASPLAVAQTRRLHFAKRLLDETELPMNQIAVAAGFGSVRRFNSEFLRTYKRAPRELRKHLRGTGKSSADDAIKMKLAFRPPYDFDHMYRFLAARALPGVEKLDDRGYWRTINTSTGGAVINVRPLPSEAALELRVFGAVPAELFRISSNARRVFDVAADPKTICEVFGRDELLAPLVAADPGLRIPGIWDPFECAVRAVLGQQITVAGGRTLATRLVERYGKSLDDPVENLTHLFPSPQALAAADMNGLGLTTARMTAVRDLARNVADRRIDFSAPVQEVIQRLTNIAGVGDWTAHYVAMRALAEPDSFPASDLILRRVAGNDGVPLSERQMEVRSAAWRPWRAYATMHLWHAASTKPKLAEVKVSKNRPPIKERA